MEHKSVNSVNLKDQSNMKLGYFKDSLHFPGFPAAKHKLGSIQSQRSSRLPVSLWCCPTEETGGSNTEVLL